MAEQQRKPAEQKKRPRFSENAEGRGGKKSSSVLAITCSPAATLAPAAPSPVATRMPKLAAPSPVAMAKPSATTAPALLAPGPVARKTMAGLTQAPSTNVKVEPEDGGALEKAGGAMVAVAAEEDAVGGLTAKKKRLHCAACPAALKPPISMCGEGHAVCCDCAGKNKHCGECGGAAATYTHVPCMDDLIGALELPCPYKKYGCGTSIAYHALAEHKAMCAHAPCYCLECTPPFEGSPAGLVRHLTDQTGRHRWPAPEEIEYGTTQSLVVPASSSDHRRLLLAEKDGGVFLLAVGTGRGSAGARPVTMVCVRANTRAGARPVYMGTLTVKGPPDEEGDTDTLLLYAKMASCAAAGEVDMDHGRLHGHLNPEMLHGASKDVHLTIGIEDFPDG